MLDIFMQSTPFSKKNRILIYMKGVIPTQIIITRIVSKKIFVPSIVISIRSKVLPKKKILLVNNYNRNNNNSLKHNHNTSINFYTKTNRNHNNNNQNSEFLNNLTSSHHYKILNI